MSWAETCRSGSSWVTSVEKLRKLRFLPRQALKRSLRAAARKFIINPFDSSALDVGSKLETASRNNTQKRSEHEQFTNY